MSLYKEELALDEVRLHYQKYDADANQIDSKTGNLLSGSSIILTLFSALQITLLKTGQPFEYSIFLVLSLLCFLGVIITTLMILKPQRYKTPFEAHWDGVEKAILNLETDQAAIKQLIANYLARIQHNSAINQRRATILSVSTWFFIGMMVSIVIASLTAAR